MPASARRIRRVQLPLFFLLSLCAWSIWIPQAGVELGSWERAPSLRSPLNALTVWSPGLAAILLTSLTAGGAGVRALFQSLSCWRVGMMWFVLLLEGGKWLLAFGIDRLLGRSYELGSGALFSTLAPESALMLPVVLVFTFPNALGEELGWRGFALPKLQERHTALTASLVLGLFWGFWHVPAWIAWGTVEVSVLPLLVKILHTVPAAIVFTWIYNNTRGSLLVVSLFHASIALRWYFLPSLPTPTETTLSWMVALLVVLLAGPARLRRRRHGEA